MIHENGNRARKIALYRMVSYAKENPVGFFWVSQTKPNPLENEKGSETQPF